MAAIARGLPRLQMLPMRSNWLGARRAQARSKSAPAIIQQRPHQAASSFGGNIASDVRACRECRQGQENFRRKQGGGDRQPKRLEPATLQRSQPLSPNPKPRITLECRLATSLGQASPPLGDARILAPTNWHRLTGTD